VWKDWEKNAGNWLNVTGQNIYFYGVLQWHNIHTKFGENQSTISRLMDVILLCFQQSTNNQLNQQLTQQYMCVPYRSYMFLSFLSILKLVYKNIKVQTFIYILFCETIYIVKCLHSTLICRSFVFVIFYTSLEWGYVVVQLVEALRYKLEGHRFNSGWLKYVWGVHALPLLFFQFVQWLYQIFLQFMRTNEQKQSHWQQLNIQQQNSINTSFTLKYLELCNF
jgi:hypothetical protein